MKIICSNPNRAQNRSLNSDELALNETSSTNVTTEEPDFDELDTSRCLDLALSAPPESQWYHGRLDRHTAEERLKSSGKSSCYLLRESDRKPGSYVLSHFGKTGVNHFRVTSVCGDFYIGGRQFNSLSELIGYYTNYSDLLKRERLTTPLPPPEPVNDKKVGITDF